MTEVAGLLNWNEIVQAKKIVLTSDQSLCGNVIAEYKDNIIVIEGAIVKSHEYMIPKSKVDYYNGEQLYLNVPRTVLSEYDF